MGWFVNCGHQIDGIAGGCEEEELEDGVVGATGEGPEQINIASYVDYQIQRLRFEGYSRAGLDVRSLADGIAGGGTSGIRLSGSSYAARLKSKSNGRNLLCIS